MKKPSLLRYAFLLGFILIYTSLPAQVEISTKLEDIAVVDEKIMMPMSDGTRLCTNVYRPKTDKPVPIIFSRTPYNFNSWGDGEERKRTKQRAYEAVKRGYAYVVQNERGRYFSEGVNGIFWAYLNRMLTTPLPGWQSSPGVTEK